LKANWAEIAEQRDDHPLRVMTRLTSKKKAQSAEQEGAGRGTAAEEVDKDITADNTVTEEHDHVANNAGEAESSDITEEAGEAQGAEVNTAQNDPQEVQASTDSTNGISRKSRILEKKARRRELDKMKPGEIVGEMVLVKEEDGNEWLGKVVTRDVKVKASNPHKYLVEDKYGKGYRVDFLDEDWKWHQVQEEVLLVMLPPQVRTQHGGELEGQEQGAGPVGRVQHVRGDRWQHAH
jgi:hypothetical protein